MEDPYILENGTLENKLNITDKYELDLAERNITFSKFLNVDSAFKGDFDVEYLKAIHKHVFENVFNWAGQFRTVPIVKEEIVLPGLSLDYSNPKDIKKDLENA